MKPITRETITDRRQSLMKWSAIFAGATVAVALWVLMQLLGMGIGLAAIDVDDAGSLRNVGIGTTVWTLIAPLIALFVGGLVAGRLATTFDRRNGAMHGFVVGALSSLLGIFAIVTMVSMLAGGMRTATGDFMVNDDITVDPDMRQREVQQVTENTGKVMLGAAISLLLGIGAAVAGGALVARRYVRPRVITAEVPVVPPPDRAPLDAPHMRT